MMAVDVGMTILLEGVALVTEMAEYYRSIIQDEVIAIAFSMREDQNLQRQGGLGGFTLVFSSDCKSCRKTF